jgi:four helix bundle protein
MIRAAESIPFNIVEGCGARGNKEFARFLDISIKSSSELEYQLQLGRDYGVLPKRDWQSLTAEVIEVRKMLCGLRRAVLAAGDTAKPARASESVEVHQSLKN